MLGLTSPQAGQIWKSRADVRRVMEGLQALEEGDGRPGVEVGTNVQVRFTVVSLTMSLVPFEAARTSDTLNSFHSRQIPKCQKTTSLQGTLRAYVASGVTNLWAETKYDGERCVFLLTSGSAPLVSFTTTERPLTILCFGEQNADSPRP